MDITLKRIIEELQTHHKKKTDLTEHLGMVNSAFGNWIAGRNKSYLKYLHAIADFLDVSVEYLKGETDQKRKPPVIDDKELERTLKFALFNGEDGVTDEMLEEVKRYAAYIMERNK